jgi:gliding motility-associated-like protein
MLRIITLFCSVFIIFSSIAQTLIINEVSQGPAGGNKEYIEFVVVDNTVTYDCNSLVPPCIDIRGWIFDDNSGYHGSNGVAGGACRFSYNSIWSCVPLGTIIVVYNNGDLNVDMPPNDLSMDDGNCRIVAPISNTTLFESNSTTPGAVACDYPATGWTPGGSWSTVLLANTGDCARIVDLSGCEVFSVCWAENNQNNLIYFQSGGTVSNNVHYFNDGDPFLQSNWSEGNCGSNGLPNNQTPGAPNNAANAAYINQFNNNCQAITPIVASVVVDNNEICGCDGQATASGSGSIPGYTYEWLDNLGNPIGQTTATATGLCQGTYTVVVTSSIDCSDSETVSIIQEISSLEVGITNNTGSTVLTCTTTSISVTATGGVSYTWDNGLGTNAIATITSPGVYTVTATGANGCTGTASITITQDITPPTAGITNNTSATELSCTLTSISVTATGGGSYSWDNGLGTNANATIIAPGTYTVTVTAANGCTATSSIAITQDITPPTAGITNNTGDAELSCTLTSISVTATGGVTYSWDNGIGTNANATITSAGVYTVTATGANGCTDSETITITADPSVPIAEITNNKGTNVLTCTTTSISVTASGGVSYSWNGGLGNTAEILITIPGIYTVTVTGSNGCTATASITITEDITSPSIAITNNTGTTELTCLVTSISLTATGGISYSWDNSLGTSASVTITEPGVYTVTGTGTNGCINNDVISITENIFLPTATISGGASYCPGATVNNVSASVTGTGPWTVNYTLDGTPQTATGSTSPISLGNTPGVYVLTGVQDALCSNTASGSQTITILSNPVITLTPTNPATCNGSDGSILVSGSGSGNVFWSGTSSGNANGVSLNYTISNLTAGTYDVYFVDGATGCQSATVSTTLLNTSGPSLTVSNPAAVCSPATVDLTASASTDIGTISYYTDAAYTTLVTDPTAVGPGTYYIVADDAGCTDEGTITVVVNPLPVINGGADVIVCQGTSVTLSGSGGVSYTWTNGGINGVAFTPALGTTVYTVTGTDANGCVGTDDVTVNVVPVPNAQLSADVIYGVPPLSVTFTNNSTDANSYVWDMGNGNTFTTVATGTEEEIYSAEGVYTIILTASNGICSDIATVLVTVQSPAPIILVPNVFSPNGDNSNDVFFIDNMYLSTLNVKIFNRWGNLMHEITDPAGAWDGTTPDGKEASDGVYFFTYFAVGLNQTELSGHGNVTLVR